MAGAAPAPAPAQLGWGRRGCWSEQVLSPTPTSFRIQGQAPLSLEAGRARGGFFFFFLFHGIVGLMEKAAEETHADELMIGFAEIGKQQPVLSVLDTSHSFAKITSIVKGMVTGCLLPQSTGAWRAMDQKLRTLISIFVISINPFSLRQGKPRSARVEQHAPGGRGV